MAVGLAIEPALNSLVLIFIIRLYKIIEFDINILMEDQVATTKGLFLNALVNIVRGKLGEKGLEVLRQKFGNLKFSGFHDYPADIANSLQNQVALLIYSKDTPEAEEGLGYQAFQVFAHSLIGKTMLQLFGGSAIQLARNVQTIAKTVTQNLDVTLEEVNESGAVIHFKNSGYNSSFYKGMMRAAAEIMKVNMTRIEIISKSSQDFSFHIQWKI